MTDNSKVYTRHFQLILVSLLIILVLSLLFTLCLGAMKISPINTYNIILEKIFGVTPSTDNIFTDAEVNIIWKIRLPRVLLSIFVGAGLALCGGIMQATVQNPMAEPYILGISSGAYLGAVFSIFLGLGVSTALGAFIGSVIATIAVISLASYGGRITSIKLVLSGMVVNTLFSAISNFTISLSGDSEGTMSMKFWTMGSLTRAKWDNIWFPIIIVVLCSIFFITQYRILNTMLAGDEAAITLGINLTFYRKIYMLVVSLLTGVLVSACGIIGFVGLIIPHIVRSLVGADHKKLIPVCLLVGSIFLVWADAIARILISNREIPIGIITALIGSPLFIYILIETGYGFGTNN
ncbi:iron complex transport system permease protein [Tissierella praeacuta]|uniref:FecCD family ABC transporter permease n=1 Tax=Tissierella praeacuta TaxID=43131 RepID=UPI00104AFCF1|nr:iron ABC transporter permease [Tissierella praeacuta]TCU66438.1 iron complex transport system permease protein [Tissierella praeacuta]